MLLKATTRLERRDGQGRTEFQQQDIGSGLRRVDRELEAMKSKATGPDGSRPELSVGTAHFRQEVGRRTPWMLLSLAAGVAMIWIGQSYEDALSKRIELVFFIPMIVYMSDSIGTETLALFVRELAIGRVHLRRLLLKESFVGLSLGIITGVPMGLFSYVWLNDLGLALIVAITMTINGLISVLVGMLVPVLFSRLKRDPAIGTDEITTALSDNLSILVYLIVATVSLFGI